MIVRLSAALIAAMCAATCALVAIPTAAAQPAAAIGQPLPDSSLRDGTITVRIIAGDRSQPVTGAEITLTLAAPNGQGTPEEKRARTDAEGRAQFTDIAMGTLVKASIPGEAQPIESSQFPMPQSGGIRLMLSTKPMAGDAPMMGGGAAGGPPMSPRTMSGQPRPEQGDQGDTITARLSYDDFADIAGLAGLPVVLAAYRHDQQISAQLGRTDATGRVTWTGLDRRGATTYFAMALLPRGAGFDRLTTLPVLLDGMAGVRVILSGEKRTAEAPPVDDLSRLDEQPKAGIPAGSVRVQFAGVPEDGTTAELIDLLTGAPVGKAGLGRPLVDLDSIKLQATPVTADPALTKGALVVTLTHEGAPLTGRAVTLRKVGATPTEAELVGQVDNGVATFTGVPAGAFELRVAIDGDAAGTTTLTTTGVGARSTVDVAWLVRGEAGAAFTGVPTGGEHAYAVRAVMHNQVYLSAPFQLGPDRGAAITVLVMPRIMFQWSLTSFLDDVFLGVRGSFGVRNASWAPYLAGTDARPDDLVIPLPDGFQGAIVRDEFQAMVGVDPAKGFVIRRPIPPGGMQFVAGFSLKVDGGTVRWSMPLPLGTFESGIEIKKAGNANVVLPDGVKFKVEEATDERGGWMVLSPITILPGKTMQFEIHDLPHEAWWRTYGRRLAGGLVLLLLTLGTVFALVRPKPGTLPTARFDALLDELAALEASGENPARKAELMTQLETLYRQQPK